MWPHKGDGTMTDERSLYTEDGEPAEETAPEPASTRQRFGTVIGVAIVLVVFILALLMLRGCDSVLNSANRRSSSNQIVPVPAAKPVTGQISVWLTAGTDLQATLATARVRASEITDMGNGQFVIGVAPGHEVDDVRRLRDVKGVYDAGRVYSDDSKP
jgi:hypothetical protein